MTQVVHSDDAFAQVAYLNLCKMHLEDKAVDQQVCIGFMDLLASFSAKNLPDFYRHSIEYIHLSHHFSCKLCVNLIPFLS